jgi:hypothetical protein
VSAGVGIAEKRQSARVGQTCIADHVANNVRGYGRASGSSVGENPTVQSQSFSFCQYGSKPCLRLVPKVVRLLD